MAEIVGVVASGVTRGTFHFLRRNLLASKSSVIEMRRNADEEHAIIPARLKIEQCRLYMWATTMRLTNGPQKRPNSYNPAAHPSETPFANVVHDLPSSIFMLFENTSQTRPRCGCEKLKPSQNQAEIPRAALRLPVHLPASMSVTPRL